MMYKALNNLSPPYLSDLFHKVNAVHQRCTRSSETEKLYVPFSRLECGKRRFSVKGALQWNGLCNNVRDATSISQFKRLYWLELNSF